MNSCILMATIVDPPQLRYTQENQLPISQMLVEFEVKTPNPQACSLKVVGFGNLATEMEKNYHKGDQVILVGRLSIRNIEHKEGYKEKKAELTVSQIYPLTTGNPTISESKSDQPIPLETHQFSQARSEEILETALPSDFPDVPVSELDDIPF